MFRPIAVIDHAFVTRVLRVLEELLHQIDRVVEVVVDRLDRVWRFIAIIFLAA